MLMELRKVQRMRDVDHDQRLRMDDVQGNAVNVGEARLKIIMIDILNERIPM